MRLGRVAVAGLAVALATAGIVFVLGGDDAGGGIVAPVRLDDDVVLRRDEAGDDVAGVGDGRPDDTDDATNTPGRDATDVGDATGDDGATDGGRPSDGNGVTDAGDAGDAGDATDGNGDATDAGGGATTG